MNHSSPAPPFCNFHFAMAIGHSPPAFLPSVPSCLRAFFLMTKPAAASSLMPTRVLPTASDTRDPTPGQAGCDPCNPQKPGLPVSISEAAGCKSSSCLQGSVWCEHPTTDAFWPPVPPNSSLVRKPGLDEAPQRGNESVHASLITHAKIVHSPEDRKSNPKSEARNPKQIASTPKSETRNPKPDTRHPIFLKRTGSSSLTHPPHPHDSAPGEAFRCLMARRGFINICGSFASVCIT